MIKLFEFGPRPILTALLLILSLVSANLQAHSERHFPPNSPAELETAGFAVQPPTLTAATAARVAISLTLADAGQRFADNRLLIERRSYQPNGAEVYKPIGYLGGGCGKADKHRNQRNCESRGDSVFAGVIDLEPTVTGVVMLRATGYELNSRRFLATLPVSIPVVLACGPTANILPIRIAEAEQAVGHRHKHHHHHGSANRPYQVFDFDVPRAGNGVLRLVNGGSVGAAFNDRFEAAVIELNGRAVKRVNKHDNVVELSVELQQGANQLKIVEMAGRSGQSLSARIDACADQVELKPIADSLRIDDVLPVQAAVRGLGMPVDGAGVMFGLPGLAEPDSVAATTTSSGLAGAEFKLIAEGEGELQVSVVGANPALSDSTPVHVLSQPSLLLNQGRGQITLTAGESIQQPYFLFHTASLGAPIHVQFSQRIEPANGGLTAATPSVPVEGYPFVGPGSVSFESTLQALAAGEYKLVATATIAETRETFSLETAVSVVDPSAPKPLSLGAPSLTPPGVAPNTSAPVKITALAGGTDAPPASLLVDEVDDQDHVVASTIAVLRDDGNGVDAVPGDSIYSGNAVFNRTAAADLRIRVRADYFGAEVASPATVFSVTPFALQGPPVESGNLIPVSDGLARVYGNEILLTLLPDTAPSRVSAIASALNGQILSVIPSLQLYRLQIAGDGSLQTLQNAIAKALEFAEVVRATPNSEVTFAGAVCGNAGDGYCPSDPRLADQWYLDTIKAKQAWSALRSIDPATIAGSTGYQLAVIDNGVNCTHRDLSGQCTVDDGSSGNNHATQVAGIIAASAENNTDGAGIAWNSRINAFALTGYDLNSVLTALDAAKGSSAKVINMSFTTDALNSGQVETLRGAACDMANAGKLMVAAAGNVASGAAAGIEKFPAKLNDSSFMCGNTPLSSYMLTVGGSNESDALATWSSSKSNTATWVDLYAPATNIISTDANNGYSSGSGTSFAAPQVAASAAVLWNSMPAGTTAIQVHDRLLRSADTVAGLGKRLNLFAAVVPIRLNINFQFEDAAFQNLFGIYDKVSRKAKILVDNVDLETNPSLSSFATSLLLTDAGYANLEYFMIPNGAQINAAYLSSVSAANRNLEVFRATDGKWRLRDADGTVLGGQPGEADALFSDPALNPDVGRAQVQKVALGSVDDFELRWEDRPAAFSDNDYNDAIFRIVKQGN